MHLVKQIQLKCSVILDELCFLSKNLFNVANYEIRQEFFNTGQWLRYNKLYHRLKSHTAYKKLHFLAGSHPPQQVLRQVEYAWKIFFKTIKIWKKNPLKFLGMPKPPKYKPKNGKNLVIFTNQQCRVKENKVLLTGKLMDRGFPKIKTNLVKIKGVRIVPASDRYNIELIYEQRIKNLNINKNRYLGIDLGLTNLVTTSNNIGLHPMLVKGGIIKSINQYYNKMLAKNKSLVKRLNGKDTTNRILKLHRKRNNKIRDLFHKTSKKIIDYCISNDIGTIIIGYNAGWKQIITLGKKNNQKFVQVPFFKFIKQLEYKAELVGIIVVRSTEEFTSQTYSKCGIISRKNRKHRGLYVCSNCGIVLNADVNGAINIMQKVIPESVKIGDIGHLNCPVRITV